MSLKNFIKDFIMEQDENVVMMSADEYTQLLDDVGGVASRIPMLKEYRGKDLVIVGDLNLSKRRNVGPLTGLSRVHGRLDISYSNVPNLDGITTTGYVNKFNSLMYENELKQIFNQKKRDLEELRENDEWNIENGSDDSLRTEALFQHLITTTDYVTDENGDIVKDKYDIIYPSGRGNYGVAKRYEIMDDYRSDESYDVYTESELDVAARRHVQDLIDDVGINSFSKWVFENNIDTEEWRSWLTDFYDDIITNDPEGWDIPKRLSDDQTMRIEKYKQKQKEIDERIRKGDLDNEKVVELRQTIESIEELIDNEIDNPKGDDYDEEMMEQEVNSRVEDYIDNIVDFSRDYGMNDDFIMSFIDIDGITEDVVNSDGYGHLLNNYDGSSDEYKIDGTWYYVFRTN